MEVWKREPSVEEQFRRWLETERGVSGSSLDRYCRDVRNSRKEEMGRDGGLDWLLETDYLELYAWFRGGKSSLLHALDFRAWADGADMEPLAQEGVCFAVVMDALCQACPGKVNRKQMTEALLMAHGVSENELKKPHIRYMLVKRWERESVEMGQRMLDYLETLDLKVTGSRKKADGVRLLLADMAYTLQEMWREQPKWENSGTQWLLSRMAGLRPVGGMRADWFAWKEEPEEDYSWSMLDLGGILLAELVLESLRSNGRGVWERKPPVPPTEEEMRLLALVEPFQRIRISVTPELVQRQGLKPSVRALLCKGWLRVDPENNQLMGLHGENTIPWSEAGLKGLWSVEAYCALLHELLENLEKRQLAGEEEALQNVMPELVYLLSTAPKEGELSGSVRGYNDRRGGRDTVNLLTRILVRCHEAIVTRQDGTTDPAKVKLRKESLHRLIRLAQERPEAAALMAKTRNDVDALDQARKHLLLARLWQMEAECCLTLAEMWGRVPLAVRRHYAAVGQGLARRSLEALRENEDAALRDRGLELGARLLVCSARCKAEDGGLRAEDVVCMLADDLLPCWEKLNQRDRNAKQRQEQLRSILAGDGMWEEPTAVSTEPLEDETENWCADQIRTVPIRNALQNVEPGLTFERREDVWKWLGEKAGTITVPVSVEHYAPVLWIPSHVQRDSGLYHHWFLSGLDSVAAADIRNSRQAVETHLMKHLLSCQNVVATLPQMVDNGQMRQLTYEDGFLEALKTGGIAISHYGKGPVDLIEYAAAQLEKTREKADDRYFRWSSLSVQLDKDSRGREAAADYLRGKGSVPQPYREELEPLREVLSIWQEMLCFRQKVVQFQRPVPNTPRATQQSELDRIFEHYRAMGLYPELRQVYESLRQRFLGELTRSEYMQAIEQHGPAYEYGCVEDLKFLVTEAYNRAIAAGISRDQCFVYTQRQQELSIYDARKPMTEGGCVLHRCVRVPTETGEQVDWAKLAAIRGQFEARSKLGEAITPELLNREIVGCMAVPPEREGEKGLHILRVSLKTSTGERLDVKQEEACDEVYMETNHRT